ncbi:hypothetical protein Zmor_012396 [Zophobas morio]|uniref:Uncharacterized protein n=1 Tax=Zophobas morio TaxID=2755281 RepID=A0AA38LXU2_9CUCU|nr:hypothetical protein Zmor_012396 [Zophobas morio]
MVINFFLMHQCSRLSASLSSALCNMATRIRRRSQEESLFRSSGGRGNSESHEQCCFEKGNSIIRQGGVDGIGGRGGSVVPNPLAYLPQSVKIWVMVFGAFSSHKS